MIKDTFTSRIRRRRVREFCLKGAGKNDNRIQKASENRGWSCTIGGNNSSELMRGRRGIVGEHIYLLRVRVRFFMKILITLGEK